MGRVRNAKGSLPVDLAKKTIAEDVLSGHAKLPAARGQAKVLERHVKRVNCCTFTTTDLPPTPLAPLSY